MNIQIKHFNELNTNELFDIFKFRVEVFIVEQKCYYQEVDDHDKEAYHVFSYEDGNLIAYARVLPKGHTFDEVSIGRVISKHRRIGNGTKIMQAALDTAIKKFNADIITIEAQTYAKKLYENLGFKQISDEFLEDAIPHIKMRWVKDSGI